MKCTVLAGADHDGATTSKAVGLLKTDSLFWL